MDTIHLQLAQRVADRFRQLPEVEAVAIAGSRVTPYSSLSSDIDVYIYPTQDLPAEVRIAIGREFSPQPEQVDYWGAGIEWDDPETGIHIDTIYFNASWMQDQVERVVVRHEASLGYSTALWHTIRQSQPLFDRTGWFERLQNLAKQPYPEALVHNIVTLNYPVLRKIAPSYRSQIEKAASRGDLVSLNHRTAGFLASYFDIIFAVNRLTHPGEKRILQIAEALCASLPHHMHTDVEHLLHAAVQPDASTQAIDILVDRLDTWLNEQEITIQP